MTNQEGVTSNPKYTIPEPRAVVVRRQRLLDFLHQHVDLPVQLVSAPAGYGKTTLMSDFAKDIDVPVCWYTVDELDRDPHSFLINIYNAIQMKFPALDVPSVTEHEHVSSSDVASHGEWQGLVNGLVEGIRRSVREFFILIIDDLHMVSTDSTILSAADLLIQKLPENCRVIISTREIPQLASLPRLISQRKVSGIGPSELRFTSDEIKALIKMNFDLDITDEEAERMEKESEGWITAILLTTHSLWKGLFRDALVANGQNSLLFDYMAAEVFSQLPPAVQRFLLSTSICNEFDAELGNVLNSIDNAQEVIQDIESRNLFITRLDGPQPWYRYHNLFRDFLRERLQSVASPDFLHLHAVAAEYYLQMGDHRQAIHYYIQGAEYTKALELLEAHAESLSHAGLWDTLGNWLEQIPADIRATKPHLLLYLVAVYQRRGDTDDAIKLSSEIIEVFHTQSEYIYESRALIRRSTSLRSKGAAQMAIRDARRALKLIQERGEPVEEAEVRVHIGRSFAQQGKYPRAERELKLALDGYQEQGDLYKVSDIHMVLGTVYVQLGESVKAVNHFQMARQGWQRLGNEAQLAETLNNMAYQYFEQGRYEDAEPLINEAITLARTTNSKQIEALTLMTQAEIQREQGNYDDALSSYQMGIDLARQYMETPLVSAAAIGMGETYRLMGDSHKAKSLLKEGMTIAADLGQDFELGIAYTSLGIIEYEAMNYAESEVLLERACELLARSKQKRNLARATFHLAHALFQSKRYPEAIERLQTTAQLCGELGYDRFLVTDIRRAPLMVQYAATTSGSGKEFFTRIKDYANGQSLRSVLSEITGDVDLKTPISVPSISVRAFGLLRIEFDGNPILSTAWGSTKAREMFLFLLYDGQAIHKEKIANTLWPDVSPSKANSNFHSTLHRVKSTLYANSVKRDGELYRLNPEWNLWLDASEFDRLLGEAEQLTFDDPNLEVVLGSVIKLYSGPFLEDIDSEWCNRLRSEMEFKFWKAVKLLADLYMHRNEPQRSVGVLESALEIDPYQEEIYHKVMDLQDNMGNAVAASRVHQRCVSMFGKTLPLE